MIKKLLSLSTFVLFMVINSINAQEITIFDRSDFDLKGPVKTCLVSTDYGKEKYSFNEAGLLTESLTRYNDQDYDLTQYKYENNELIEKRFEIYRDQKLDKSTSMAYLYSIDTVDTRKVTEKIITYDKQYLEQYQHYYNADGNKSKLVRTNEGGIDETSIIYFKENEVESINHFQNNQKELSIKTTYKNITDSTSLKTVLTKRFIGGSPENATEEVYNGHSKLISKKTFGYNSEINQFELLSTKRNSYNKNGMLEQVILKEGNRSITENYIYQFDAKENGNWIKQIITPKNSYKTRNISYYTTDETKPVE